MLHKALCVFIEILLEVVPYTDYSTFTVISVFFEGEAKFGNIVVNFLKQCLFFMGSEELSHMLYAAADMVLVPSIYEPCGLAQMIGMRYGAVCASSVDSQKYFLNFSK